MATEESDVSQTISSNSAYDQIMNPLLHQLIAVATTLILALPPGSCGDFVQHDRTDSAPVKKVSCCHETSHKRPCNSGNFPSKTSVKCCCERDAALPEKSAHPTDSLGLAFTVVADHREWHLDNLLGGRAAVIPARSGPRLQILLCVWRC